MMKWNMFVRLALVSLLFVSGFTAAPSAFFDDPVGSGEEPEPVTSGGGGDQGSEAPVEGSGTQTTLGDPDSTDQGTEAPMDSSDPPIQETEVPMDPSAAPSTPSSGPGDESSNTADVFEAQIVKLEIPISSVILGVDAKGVSDIVNKRIAASQLSPKKIIDIVEKKVEKLRPRLMVDGPSRKFKLATKALLDEYDKKGQNYFLVTISDTA